MYDEGSASNMIDSEIFCFGHNGNLTFVRHSFLEEECSGYRIYKVEVLANVMDMVPTI